MNSRERFLACMRFQPVDRVPNWEMGYWAGVLDEWHDAGELPRHPLSPTGLYEGEGVKGEGFPWKRSEPKDYAANAFFGFDKGIEKLDVNWGICPQFEPEVLWEDDENIKRLNGDGEVVLVRKDSTSLPHPVGWSVTDRASWEKLKSERLRIDMAGRLPAQWSQYVEEYKTRDWPLVIGGPFVGVFSSLRTLFGFQNLMYAFFDDPQLVKDVLSHLTELWLGLYEEVLAQTDVDFAYIWEDMSFKSGSMVSPRIFREFLMPVYKRLNGFLRAHGIDITLLDTDGNVWGLIPLFLEGGVTGLYPFEVRSGMDVAEVRKKFPTLQMMGGIDKTALLQGKDAIDAEIDRVAPVVRTGGYIPGIDHYVQPGVPWASFKYYRRRMLDMI